MVEMHIRQPASTGFPRTLRPLLEWNKRISSSHKYMHTHIYAHTRITERYGGGGMGISYFQSPTHTYLPMYGRPTGCVSPQVACRETCTFGAKLLHILGYFVRQKTTPSRSWRGRVLQTSRIRLGYTRRKRFVSLVVLPRMQCIDGG